MTASPDHEHSSLEADLRPGGSGVSARLAALINPQVLAERRLLIETKLRDEAMTRVLRRRCAEVVANHLLEVANDERALSLLD